MHIALNIKHTFPQIKMLDDDLRVALDVVVSENVVLLECSRKGRGGVS